MRDESVGQGNDSPFTRIDAAPFFARDIAHVRHVVRMLLAGEAFDLFGSISDK